jgi:hypothetical protein
MRNLIFAGLLGFVSCQPAYAFRLVDAELEVGKLYNYYDPSAPKYSLFRDKHDNDKYGTNEAWDSQIGLRVATNVLELPAGYYYLDQEVIGDSTTHQYRRVTYAWETGLSVPDQAIRLFWNHQSEHLLDTVQIDHYPVRDFYGVRICLMGSCKR